MPATYKYSSAQPHSKGYLLCWCSHIRRGRKSLKFYSILIVLLIVYRIYFTFSPRLPPQMTPVSQSLRIMYVIRTSSKFHQTRLKYLLQTWVALISKDVYFVTDQPLPGIPATHTILTKNTCGNETHSMKALCCKTTHDFILFQRHLSKYDWFCHFDDDQYVHVENLEKYLATLDPNSSYYIGRNSWPERVKRAKKPFPAPFWFATLGAGVCLSKNLVHRLAPHTHEISQFVNGCLKENYHDDIYLGFLISAYTNVTLTKNVRFHSHLEKDFYQKRDKFLQMFPNQITFGFRMPGRYPIFLPNLYEPHADLFRMRTLHCLLYPHVSECRVRIRKRLINPTNQ